MTDASDPVMFQRPNYRSAGSAPGGSPPAGGAGESRSSPPPVSFDQTHDFSYEENADPLARPFLSEVRAEQFSEDTPIFEGGPPYSQVLLWMKMAQDNGHFVGMTEFGGQRYIWRTINRVEYKEIIATPNTDPLTREEMICEIAVLWPQPFDVEQMAKGRAGIPTLLAQQIMLASGFDRSVGYRPLF